MTLTQCVILANKKKNNNKNVHLISTSVKYWWLFTIFFHV